MLTGIPTVPLTNFKPVSLMAGRIRYVRNGTTYDSRFTIWMGELASHCGGCHFFRCHLSLSLALKLRCVRSYCTSTCHIRARTKLRQKQYDLSDMHMWFGCARLTGNQEVASYSAGIIRFGGAPYGCICYSRGSRISGFGFASTDQTPHQRV
jgi:hypothetical protein